MENKKEKTAPDVSVGADTEQPLFKNTTSSISKYQGRARVYHCTSGEFCGVQA